MQGSLQSHLPKLSEHFSIRLFCPPAPLFWRSQFVVLLFSSLGQWYTTRWWISPSFVDVTELKLKQTWPRLRWSPWLKNPHILPKCSPVCPLCACVCVHRDLQLHKVTESHVLVILYNHSKWHVLYYFLHDQTSNGHRIPTLLMNLVQKIVFHDSPLIWFIKHRIYTDKGCNLTLCTSASNPLLPQLCLIGHNNFTVTNNTSLKDFRDRTHK